MLSYQEVKQSAAATLKQWLPHPEQGEGLREQAQGKSDPSFYEIKNEEVQPSLFGQN
jgi:hypothetical protein